MLSLFLTHVGLPLAYLSLLAVIVWILVIITRRGGSFQISLQPLSFAVDLSASDRQIIHYPVLVRAMRDLASIVHSNEYQLIGRIYSEIMIGVSRCGKGSENRAALMLLNEEKNILFCKEAVRHSIDAKNSWTFDLTNHQPATIAYTDQRVYNCPNVAKDSLWTRLPQNQEPTPYQSFICVPVTVNNKHWGILIVDSEHKNAFNTYAEQDLKTYATILGFVLALEYKEMEETLHE
ncbi:MAG: GAF domain-containing protein [Firmicutes bacterium]|nr:GAF domain-containing protein [Bacillota bacterium]